MKAFITLAVVCFIVQAMAGPLELSAEQKAKAKEHFVERVGNLKDDQVQKDVILKKLGSLVNEDMAVIKAVLSNCNDYKGEGRPDTALNVYKCFVESEAELTA